MLRILPILVLASLLTSCSSGGGDGGGLGDAQTRALGCTRATTVNVVRLLDRIEKVMLVALGDPQDGVTVTPTASANTFDYEVEFDADNDRTDDTRITGQITFPQDPANGIPGGMDIPVTYVLAPLGNEGPLSGEGEGTLHFETPRQATVAGMVSLTDEATGCASAVSFDTDTTVRVIFSEPVVSAVQLTATIHEMRLWGKLGLNLTTDRGERFVGTMSLSATGQNATVDGTLDGSNFRHTYSVFPDDIEALTQCIQELAPVYADMTGIFLALSQVIDQAGGDLSAVPETPGWTIELTSNKDVANYAIDLTRFGVLMDGGRIDGQVRISRVGFRIAMLWSWRLQGRIGAEVVGGQSALFFRVQYAAGGAITSVGAGSLVRDACEGAFEIPDSDPIVQPAQGGSILFGGTVGVHIIEADMAVGLGGAVSRQVLIDDIPAPVEVAFSFTD